MGCVPSLLFGLRPNWDSHLHWRLPDTHRQVWLSLPLTSKVKFLGGSQSLCQIPRLGDLLWVLEPSNLFGIIVLQFVGHLLCGSMVRLMVTSSKRTYATRLLTQVHCTQSPVPAQATADLCRHRRHSNTQRQVWLSLSGVSRLWCTCFVWAFWTLWWVWGLILNVILPLLPPYWGSSFAFGHGVSFFGGIQHSPIDGCLAVSCNFGVLTGEDERTILLLCHLVDAMREALSL